MTILEQIMTVNREFARNSSPICEITGLPVGKTPKKKLAVFTCMDTRLVDFLEPALGLRREDAVIIKDAGNSVTGPFDAVIRSLVIAIFELGVEEVIIIGHEDCGVAHATADDIVNKMLARGISADAIKMIQDEMDAWIDSFHHPHDNVRTAVEKIKNNPLIPADVPIHGLIFDPHTGEITILINGYE